MSGPSRRRTTRGELGLLAAAVCILGVAGGVGEALGGWDFVRQHWAPLLVAALLCAALVTVGWKLASLVLRGALLSVRRPRELGQSGAAMAEFVIVVIPFLLMLTALMQLALASLGRVLVSYAAFCAARAAIVIVPIDGAAGDKDVYAGLKDELKDHVGYGANTRGDFMISKKASYIRNAASYAMIPASPSIDTVITDTINNWGNYWPNRAKGGLQPGLLLVDVLAQGLKLDAAAQQDFSDQLKAILQSDLSTPDEKAAAIARANALIDQTYPPDQRADVKNQIDSYIQNYSGQSGGNNANTGWFQGAVDGTLNGGLEKYAGDVLGMVEQGMMGRGGVQQGGSFGGYAVDRALDSGFGGGTDGAGGAILRSLRKLIYARVATVVELEGANGQIKTSFAPDEPITAKVTYLYYCQIPLANRFAGKPFYDLPLETQLDMTTGPLGYGAAVGIPGYFMAMTAKHTLVNQGKP